MGAVARLAEAREPSVLQTRFERATAISDQEPRCMLVRRVLSPLKKFAGCSAQDDKKERPDLSFRVQPRNQHGAEAAIP